MYRARERSGLRSTSPARRRHRPLRAKGRATTLGLSRDLRNVRKPEFLQSVTPRAAPGPAIGKHFRDPPSLHVVRPEEMRKIQVIFKPVPRIPDGICTLVWAADLARSLLKSIFIVDVEDKNCPAGHYMLVLIDVWPSDFEAAAERLVGPMAEPFEEGPPVEMACLRNEVM